MKAMIIVTQLRFEFMQSSSKNGKVSELYIEGKIKLNRESSVSSVPKEVKVDRKKIEINIL